jgi:urease alpha subunit
VLAIDDEKLDTLSSDIKVMGQVGEIVVKVLRRTEAKVIRRKIEQENLLSDNPLKVHEKALKGQAKSHSTS